MSICRGCAFEYEWTQNDTSCPDECIHCVVRDGKATKFKPKPVTKADRIREWNDHELAEAIANFVSEIDNGDVRYSDDPNDWIELLRQSAEGE